MRDRFTAHERAWRGPAYLNDAGNVTICGAGALGANLAESLARCGVGPIVVVDRDRVEASNLGTQPYVAADVGAPKAEALAFALDAAVHAHVSGVVVELGDNTAVRLLRGSRLVIDAFDNHAARAQVQETCRQLRLPCLHVGMSGDGYGEAAWDDGYMVPADSSEPAPCDYPLARSLVMLVTAAATEVVLRMLEDGRRDACCVTLGDLHMERTKQ